MTPLRCARASRTTTTALLATTALASLSALVLVPSAAQAAEPVARDLTSTLTEDFDTLAASGTSSTVPAGAGFVEAGTNANTTYRAGSGTDNAGDTYSLGSAGSTDRALGSLSSGSLQPTLGYAVRNTTGAPLTGLRVTYTGEQWRRGGSTVADRLDVAYAVNPTSLTGPGFTDVDALDLTSPVTTTTAGPLDGNAAANRTTRTADVTGFSVPVGGTLVLRWTDSDITGADDALGVDDLTLTAIAGGTTTPPPTTPADCSATDTAIGAVQGTGASTPVAGSTVTVQGVVTREYRGSTTAVNNGYYLQDAGDGDDATSDGIFVSGASHAVGDVVQVTGVAGEQFSQTAILQPTSELTCSTGAALPAPVALAVPFSGSADLERREGMVVRFAQRLLVNDTRNADDFGEVKLADVALQNPTDVAAPGAAAQAVAAANALRSIVLDDGSQLSNPRPVPYVPVGGTLRRGQGTTGLTGVLGFGFSAYRVQPTAPVAFDAGANPREATPRPVGGFLEVSSFNVLNYFTTLGSRGAQNAADLQEQQDKIVAGITALGADAVALQEIENKQSALDTLVAALNATGSGQWAGVPFPSNLSTTDVITTAIIYRADRLTRVGASIAGANPVNNRDPVAQTFEVAPGQAGAGERFTVVSNHLKSKGGTGQGTNQDYGDGQGAFNADRVAQARYLVTFINQLKQVDPDVIALGDFNSYLREDPIGVLRSAGLIDVAERLVPQADRYSFVFNGEQGALDHAIVTPELFAKIIGADHWHPNADEPDLLEYGTANNAAYYRPDAFRASDHDPLVVGIGSVGPTPVVPEVPFAPLLPLVALAGVAVVLHRRRA